MDPDEDVSLPAMSALISRFRDSLLFNFCIVVQSMYLPFFCMVVAVCYCIIVYLLLIRSTKKSRGPES